MLCQHFYPEMISTGMHMTELATALTQRGWTLTVVCAQPRLLVSDRNERVADEFTYRGIRVIRVPAWGTHSSGLFGRALFALTYLFSTILRVRRERRGVAGILLTTNPPFLGLAGWLYQRLSGLPYVLIVYDIYPDIAVRLGAVGARSLFARVWDRVTRLILNHAAAVVVIGRDMDRIVRERMREDRRDRIQLIPNWSDANTVAPVPPERNAFTREHALTGKFVVQYSGRLGRTHNLEPLVEAARILRDRPVVFQIIGDGGKRSRLRDLVSEYQLENVQFLPYQPLERLGEALSAADVSVVCLGSEFTGLSVPSKTYGVMAAGKPILALLDAESEIGLMIRESDCGVVIDQPTGESIAAALAELMRNRERLVKMGQNGLAAFTAGYTLDRASERYDACLRAALHP